MSCVHCGDPCDDRTVSHWIEDGHDGLCCDCMDLRHGMALEALNAARIAKGRAPITKPWPGRRVVDDPSDTSTS